MSQLWDLSLISLVVSASGVGDTTSTGVGSAGVPQVWPFDYWDGFTGVSGAGNTTSSAIGVGTAVLLTWYDITASVTSGAGGSGNTLSSAVDSGWTTKNPAIGDGFGNTLSEADDYAPFVTTSPPSVTGFGNTISSAYGSALRTFNTLGAETDGLFDIDQQTTESTLIRPTAAGDFILDGLPLPS